MQKSYPTGPSRGSLHAPAEIAASLGVPFCEPTTAWALRLSEPQFRCALRAVERAIYDLEAPTRDTTILHDIAVQAACEVGANWKAAVRAADRIAFFALHRRSSDPLRSKVLQGRLARMAQVFAWRASHADEDRRLYRAWRELGSLRELARLEGATLKVIRGAVDRERRRLADAALGIRTPRSYHEWRRHYLDLLGLFPAYVPVLRREFRERVDWAKAPASAGRTVSRK